MCRDAEVPQIGPLRTRNGWKRAVNAERAPVLGQVAPRFEVLPRPSVSRPPTPAAPPEAAVVVTVDPGPQPDYISSGGILLRIDAVMLRARRAVSGALGPHTANAQNSEVSEHDHLL